MSAEAATLSHPTDAATEHRRRGLRVALAVSVGFTGAVFAGAIVPFLGPLFAAQFLLGSSRPMPLAKTLGMAALILVAGLAMIVLTTTFGDRPATFLALLALIYFFCFLTQSSGRGGPAPFLVLVVAIIVPLLGILNRDLANSILSILLAGVISGTLLMWLAYAVVPEPSDAETIAQPGPIRSPSISRAVASTAILLAAVTICLTSDKLAAALVIPITVASLLCQLDITASGRAAVGLVIVNLFGGVLASVAYAILSLRPNLLSMFLIVLIAGLLLGGRAAARSKDAGMFAGALTIFLILFGLGVSPLPGSAAESFTTRIVYVAAALIYALLAAALLWRRPTSQSAIMSSSPEPLTLDNRINDQ
jgi:MFS family permease